MIKQLRPFYSPERLAQVYGHVYNHTTWPDHIERVHETIRVLDGFAARVDARTVADLSCGDGAIVNGSRHPWQAKYLGDYTTTGPIEDTIVDLSEVDVFVCSETLEHVEQPAKLLASIARKATHLLLTTPCGEWDPDNNPEHYWGWDVDGVRALLTEAGWIGDTMHLFTPVSVPLYTFQIWTCSRAVTT